jgi:hypothetical protein
MRKYLLLGLLVIFSGPACLFGQSNFIPLNEDYYHLIDRYEIKSGKIMPHFFTSVKPYKRDAVVEFSDSVNSLGLFPSRADQFNYEYIQNDSWEWSEAVTADSKKPVLKHFYKKKADLFHVSETAFDLHVNPVMYLGAGKDSRLDDMMFINTRGVEVRGMVDKKIGFYTYLTDNQTLLPSYVREQVSLTAAVPHEGFWKQYKEGAAVDFLQARGYITFEATKHVNVQFGHDRFFIGNGHRSFIFSDNGPPSWFLKGNVKVWKLNYLFLVNQMTADVAVGAGNTLIASGSGYHDKFTALHHLSINIGKKFNLGIFEAVVFDADDSTGIRLDYFNPIIFYRAIEQQNGSSDNVLLGIDFKWNAVRKLSFYGQFVLDEFVIDNLKKGNGWWANKFAIQIGGKYVDAFGVPNLDFQGEVNIAKPYTFSHNTTFGNYSGYRQPIGHPLGANFNELIGIVRYQPLPRLNLAGKLVIVQTGRDTLGVEGSWGTDILKANTKRYRDEGNEIAQGIPNDIVYGSLVASWQLRHNIFIEGVLVIRKSESPEIFYNNNSTITSLALRWNIARRQYEF